MWMFGGTDGGFSKKGQDKSKSGKIGGCQNAACKFRAAASMWQQVCCSSEPVSLQSMDLEAVAW